MQLSKSIAVRSFSVAIAIIFLLITIAAGTENVHAASKLKVTPGSSNIYVGKTVSLKANTNVKWSVSKGKGIVKLTSSKKKSVKVKGLKTGVAYITAKSGKQSSKVKIVVAKKGAPLSIKLMSSKEIIGPGETCNVSVLSVKPESASDKVSFSSSDDSIAEVTPGGLVTGNNIGTVKITARSKADRNVAASIVLEVVDAKAGVVTATIDMSNASKYPAGKAVKAWFPVPISDENQTVSNVKFTVADKDKTHAEISKPVSGAAYSRDKVFYVEFAPDIAPADRKATLSFHVYRRAVSHSTDLRSKEKGSVDKEKFAEYLQETTYSGSLTEGIVKETADKIVADANAKTVYDKAHAIYLWIAENITRDKSLPNRELGDVVAVLSGQRDAGSCIDINSIFVALCNAEGIPARDSFGLKLQEVPGQNCRAEFYLPGYGWVEVDPAMPLGKIMYKESEYRGQDAPNAAEWEVIKETYWNTGSPSWMCLTHGRDLTFEPKQSASPEYMVNPDGTLNHLMFPYGEYNGRYIEGWGPTYDKTFNYVYTFEEEDPRDCGC